MSAMQHVFDGSPDNFRELVIDNSHKGTVLVNYWTPSAGPCFKLWQVLEQLSEEYGGRFLLVNINTDKHGALARDNGINSVPTLKIYQAGEVVDSVYGAHSAASLRNTLDKYVPQAPDPAVAEAIRSYQNGNIEDALGLLAEASRRQPDAVPPVATALKLLLREQRYTDLDACFSALPPQLQARPELSALQVHGHMLYLAATAGAERREDTAETAAGEAAALLSDAAVAMVADDFDSALENLLNSFQADRHYDGDFARRAMLAIFALLGDRHALTLDYKKRLQESLH